MTVSYALRVDEDVKQRASEVCKSYGLDLATATRAFYAQIARTKSIPLTFAVEEPNEETKAALAEAKEFAASGREGSYASADELFAALDL
ncbi:MAG: type II toxin-antitoxin system RelB/DinJ family antitoxin [Coriobacteriia bacterium]|nr:type II toxin-antitoxin system RelB/DinJ family antitoxin [Coriobacteriia bacterium]MBS5479303.1 type II toxin-antitoxin system RelB/DinJ family antitoxin [Coriobacteriia bacterium]